MKRLSAAIFVFAVVLLVAAGAAMWTNSTWAAERPQSLASTVENLKPGEPGDETAPYVGIQIQTLSDEEAEELDIHGDVRVLAVEVEGPSSGLLEQGDVIVSVGGVTVTSSRQVVRIVNATEAGEILTFTVVRDGGTRNVDVEVGEREVTVRPGFKAPLAPIGQLPGLLHNLHDSVARAEILVRTDDGFETLRVVAGTVSNLDVEIGTFDLNPEDGSSTISYRISDGTLVLTAHNDLGGLNDTDRTWVVDVDGAVKIVAQGQMPFVPQADSYHLPVPFSAPRPAPRRDGQPQPFRRAPEARIPFKHLVPPTVLERLERERLTAGEGLTIQVQ